MPARPKGDPIVASLARGVAGAARGAAGMSASLARHAVWYVRYRVDGNSRAEYKRDRARAARRR